jgi:hypothetical protein
MLEMQLREELGQAQQFHAQNAQNAQNRAKIPPLTKNMLDNLGDVVTHLDMLCEQPSCPICSEDYSCGEPVTEMPCKHIFHKLCVIPWLEAKKTCPICRFTLTNDIPEISVLTKLPIKELKRRITARTNSDMSEEKETSSYNKSLTENGSKSDNTIDSKQQGDIPKRSSQAIDGNYDNSDTKDEDRKDGRSLTIVSSHMGEKVSEEEYDNECVR